MRKIIYLDNAATTQPDESVLKAMQPYQRTFFGNPNSIHEAGRQATEAVDSARKQIADFLNCQTREVIFTSGATESNNLALRGIIGAFKEKVNHPEIITTSIEHYSVLKTCRDLEKDGIKSKYLSVDKKGLIAPETVLKNITNSTVLVSIGYVNNEIGTIEPIREIGKLIEKVNKERSLPIIFHTDAVQAACYLTCNVNYLHVDLLSLSGHKLYGPKGIGTLYIRKGTFVKETQTGGDQEYGFRSGTLNVPGIIGLGKAINILAENQSVNSQKVSQLRNWLRLQLELSIPDLQITGAPEENRIPNNLHFRIKGILGQDIVILLDQAGIAISVGSACTAGAVEPSHVLLALGYSEANAREAIRVTISKNTTKQELTIFIKALEKAVRELAS